MLEFDDSMSCGVHSAEQLEFSKIILYLLIRDCSYITSLANCILSTY